jgi:hypothetical protein
MTSQQPKFYEGQDVEVWLEKHGKWTRGSVLQRKTGDDGIVRYFLQLSGGFMATDANKYPDHWFAEDAIRANGY